MSEPIVLWRNVGQGFRSKWTAGDRPEGFWIDEYRALPVEAYATLARDLASARTALAEARVYVAAKFDPEARRVLARIDALAGEGGA